MLSNSSATAMLSNTSTILMINSTSTSVVPSTTPSCADDEDANFSCVMYEVMYNLCTAATGTLHSIAHKRCRSYCKICTSGGGGTSGTISAVSLPTQATCIDHDVRCSQYQVKICGAAVSEAFVISTCAKTCNKCAEYFASLQVQTAPLTTAPPAAQPVGTTAAVICQDNHDKPGVDCILFKASIANFCANPYSNDICAKSCGHCTSVIQSAFG